MTKDRVLRETDPPKLPGLFAIATAIQEATEPPDALTKREIGRREIRQLEDRPSLEERVDESRTSRCQEAAVPHEPPFVDHEYAPKTSPKIIPVLKHVKESRAKDARDEKNQKKIGYHLGGQTHPYRSFLRA